MGLCWFSQTFPSPKKAVISMTAAALLCVSASSVRADTLGAASSAGAAFGAQPAKGGPSDPKLTGGSDVDSPPEQRGFYERANENLALQALYLNNRIRTLRNLIQDPNPKDPKNPYTDKDSRDLEDEDSRKVIASETQGVCGGNDANDQKSDGATILSCVKQYIDLHITQLERVKSSTADNSDSIADLATHEYGPDGKPTDGKQDKPNTVGLMKLQPGKKFVKDKVLLQSVPTFAELGAKYQDPKEERVNPWFKDMSRAPDQRDFIVKREIKPDKDRNETVTRSQLGPDGKPMLDAKAFAKANADFQQGDHRYGPRHIGRRHGDKHKRWLARVERMRKNQAKLDQMAKGPMTKDKWKNKSTDRMKRDLAAARKILVDCYNNPKDPNCSNKGAANANGPQNGSPKLAALGGVSHINPDTNRKPDGSSTDQAKPKTAESGTPSASADRQKGDKPPSYEADLNSQVHAPEYKDGMPKNEEVYMTQQVMQNMIDDSFKGLAQN